MNTLLEGLNRWSEQVEERLRTLEESPTGKQKEKRSEEKWTEFTNLQDTIEPSNIYIMVVAGGEERKKGRRIFEERMAKGQKSSVGSAPSQHLHFFLSSARASGC